MGLPAISIVVSLTVAVASEPVTTSGGQAPATAETQPAAEPAPGTGAHPEIGDQDPTTRVSDPLAGDREVWRTSGFRLQLGVGYALFAGGPTVPVVQSFDIAVNVGWRFTLRWGAMAAFRYAFLVNGLSGVRWTATLEPVFHFGNGFWLSAGAGYGGIWGETGNREYPYRSVLSDPDQIDLNRPFDRAEVPPFVRCNGDGIAAVARAGLTLIVGDLFSTGPMIEIDGQWTLCSDEGFNQFVQDNEEIQIPKQWWSYFTVGASWIFAWR